MARQNKQTEAPEKVAPQEQKQSVLVHLAALRNVLVISAAAIGIAFVLIFYFAIDWLMGLILQPIEARGIEIIYTAMSEALVTKMKVGLVAAIVVASPVIIWQIWSFIKPALYPHEKKTFRVLFFVILLLFLLGVVFCYGAVYMLAVDFFLIAGENLAVPMLSVDKYVGFLFGFVVPFGIAFELPVVLYMTTRMGWTNHQMLASKRKYIILAVAVVAAVLTPPDVVSQMMLGIPMLILFEIGVLIARFVKPRERA
ncbi:MAG: twin-arginine translocase subunit TatC [Clostridia bacterium]|nr:twin-arginine translocase subunit TatC [Clostridia bacterium]